MVIEIGSRGGGIEACGESQYSAEYDSLEKDQIKRRGAITLFILRIQ